MSKISKAGDSNDNVIYVGNIDPQVTKENLYELFVQVAPIKSINYPSDKVLQTHQGYAFIELINANNDVDYVVKAIDNNVTLYKRTLKVRRSNAINSFSMGDKNNGNVITTTSTSEILPPIAVLFVKNLHKDITVDKLRNIASKFGEQYKNPDIFSVVSRKSPPEGPQTNYGKLYFKFYRDADNALNKLNGQIIMNKPITVEYSLKDDQGKYRNVADSNRYGNEIDRLLNKEAEMNGFL